MEVAIDQLHSPSMPGSWKIFQSAGKEMLSGDVHIGSLAGENQEAGCTGASFRLRMAERFVRDLSSQMWPVSTRIPTDLRANLTNLTGPPGENFQPDLKYLVMFVINLQVVVFNVLIIANVLKAKSFQKSSSAKYFVLSLAISDLIVGLIVMPFGVISLILNTWLFGPWWCELWQTFDFFACTASIFNLCTVSIDRYVP